MDKNLIRCAWSSALIFHLPIDALLSPNTIGKLCEALLIGNVHKAKLAQVRELKIPLEVLCSMMVNGDILFVTQGTAL